MALVKQTLDFPFAGAMREQVEEKLVPPGEFVRVANGIYDKKGRIKKRPGFNSKTYASSDIMAHKLISNNKALMGCSAGTSSDTPGLYLRKSVDDTWRRVGELSEACIERHPRVRDLNTDVLDGDMGCAGDYQVYAWVDTAFIWDPNYSVHRQVRRIACRIVEQSTGVEVYHDYLSSYVDQTGSYTDDKPAHVRVTPNGTGDKVCVSWAAATYSAPSYDDTKIFGRVIDCENFSVGSTSWITAVLDRSGNANSGDGYYDACPGSASQGGWIFAWRHQTSYRLTMAVYNDDLSTSQSPWDIEGNYEVGSMGVWLDRYTGLGRIYIVYYYLNPLLGGGAGGWLIAYQVRKYSDITSTSQGRTTIDGGSAGLVGGTTFAYWTRIGLTDSGTPGDVVVTYGECDTDAGDYPEDIPDSLRLTFKWATIDLDGNVSDITTQQRIIPASKPFTRAGRVYQWLVDYRTRTYSLVQLPEGGTDIGRPVTSCAYNIGYGYRTGDLRTVSTTTEGPNRYRRGPRLAHRCLLPVFTVPLIGDDLTQPDSDDITNLDEFATFFEADGMFQHATLDNITYVSGGYISQFDGSRVVENGFLQEPWIYVAGSISAPSGGLSDGYYSWLLVYESVDNEGNRHRSAASIPTTKEIEAGYSATLQVSRLTLTHRRRAENDKLGSDVSLSVYRTVADGEIYYRLYYLDEYTEDDIGGSVHMSSGTYDPGLINQAEYGTWAHITILDYVTDEELQSHEQLYCSPNPGGVLPNDPLYGGCRSLVAHKQRLWAGGGERPSVLHYSKESEGGAPIAFNIAQQIEMGTDITGLGSLGDMLAVFSKYRIQGIFGEGPAASGDPASGSFSLPILINSDIGCTDPNSIVKYQEGIAFRGKQGICTLTNSRQVEWIGEDIQDSLDGYTIVDSSCIPDESQLLFLRDDGYTLMYDYGERKWSLWTFAWGNSADRLIALEYSDGYCYAGKTDGYCYYQNSTSYVDGYFSPIGYAFNTSWYPFEIDTGWISLGSINGFKRLWHTVLLGEVFGEPVALQVTIDKDWSTEHTQTFNYGIFTPDTGNFWKRIAIQYQLGTSWRFKIHELLPYPYTGLGALSLSALSFEYGTEGGVVKESSAHAPEGHFG